MTRKQAAKVARETPRKVHKRSGPEAERFACGQDRNRGTRSTETWDGVTCEECLAVKARAEARILARKAKFSDAKMESQALAARRAAPADEAGRRGCCPYMGTPDCECDAAVARGRFERASKVASAVAEKVGECPTMVRLNLAGARVHVSGSVEQVARALALLAKVRP